MLDAPRSDRSSLADYKGSCLVVLRPARGNPRGRRPPSARDELPLILKVEDLLSTHRSRRLNKKLYLDEVMARNSAWAHSSGSTDSGRRTCHGYNRGSFVRLRRMPPPGTSPAPPWKNGCGLQACGNSRVLHVDNSKRWLKSFHHRGQSRKRPRDNLKEESHLSYLIKGQKSILITHKN